MSDEIIQKMQQSLCEPFFTAPLTTADKSLNV